MARLRVLVWVGLLAWGASWFFSAHEMVRQMTDQGASSGPFREPTLASGPPGWKAFRLAWDLAFADPPDESEISPAVPLTRRLGNDVFSRSLFFTCLTNFAMPLVAIVLFLRIRGLGA